MLHLSTILKHYKNKELQKEILDNARDREVAVRFGDKGFGKRPDVLMYQQDILELARQGATSFHASEERWFNPLRLDTNLRKKELDELRKGWDLILDVDCHFLEYSKIAADLIIKALRYHDLRSVSCKFSGNKGFHIGIPWEAFPEQIGNQNTVDLFPEAPRKIALYLKHLIKEPLGKKIFELEKGDFSRILEKTGVKEKDVKFFKKDSFGTEVPYLNVEAFLDIDTLLISSRHLYRMPYSLHEKSGLVSIPINIHKVLGFNIKDAKPPVKVSDFKFLNRKNVTAGETKRLVVQAFDFSPEPVREADVRVRVEHKEYEIPEDALPIESFPPCIKFGLNGLADGRKRFLFILTNFLTNAGWDYDQIEKLVLEWNKKNDGPLRETIVRSHLRYRRQNKKRILPPNCDNSAYYADMRICQPDNLCVRIKNPVNYARIRGRFKGKPSESKVKKLTPEEQEEIRRKKQEEKTLRKDINQ